MKESELEVQKSKVKFQRLNVKREGFTLIEMLLVIGIATVLGIIGTANFLGLRDVKALDSNTQRIVEDLRTVSGNSLSGLEDSTWGIRFTNSDAQYYEVWRGADYASGVKTKRSVLSAKVFFVDPASGQFKDVVFARGTGLPNATLTLIISNGASQKTITMNTNGRIDY